MKPFRLHRAALTEAKAAAAHYTAINPQLGARFYDVLDQLVHEVRLDGSDHGAVVRHFEEQVGSK